MTSGKDLVRPYRGRPMFVGVVLTGFEGDWITKGSCYVCEAPHEIARCSKRQRGICEDDGVIIGQAGQEHATKAWQGASLACCRNAKACESRQRRILDFWKLQTGERLD